MPGKQELIIAEDGEYYAQVDKALGSGKFSGKYLSETGPRNVLLTLRGSLKRKKKKRNNLVEAGCWVLMVPDFDPNKGWIVSKYQDSEVKSLKKMGEITDFEKPSTSKKTIIDVPKEDSGIVFEGEDDNREASEDAQEVQPLDNDSESSFDMDAI